MNQETPLNFSLPPASLEQLSTARASIDILHSALRDNSVSVPPVPCPSRHHANVNWLGNHVKALELPKRIRQYLRHYLLYVFYEFTQWYRRLRVRLQLRTLAIPPSSSVFELVAWTRRGEIDEIMSARNIIMDARFTVVCKYRLACHYYMEDWVRGLWHQFKKEDFHNFHKCAIMVLENFNVVFWTFEMNGITPQISRIIQDKLEDTSSSELEKNPKCSVYARLLLRALKHSEIYAVRYLSRRCSHLENIKALSHFPIQLDTPRDIALFFYSFLDRAEQERHISEVGLNYLFSSISPDLIVRTFHELLPLIVQNLGLYPDVLYAITRHLDSFTFKPFPPTTFKVWGEIIDAVWVLVPEHFRTYVLCQRDPSDVALLVERLHKWGHDINVANIILYATVEQRSQICDGLVCKAELTLKHGCFADNYSLKVLNAYANRFFGDDKDSVDFDAMKNKVWTELSQLGDWKAFVRKVEKLGTFKIKRPKDIHPKANAKIVTPDSSANNIVISHAANGSDTLGNIRKGNEKKDCNNNVRISPKANNIVAMNYNNNVVTHSKDRANSK